MDELAPMEFFGVCLSCRATVALPMPHSWETPDGEQFEVSAEPSPEELAHVRQVMIVFLHELACPGCGETQIRICISESL
jgi:hypothetical protein